MIFHRKPADIQNTSNFGIGFPHGDPVHDLDFTIAQAKSFVLANPKGFWKGFLLLRQLGHLTQRAVDHRHQHFDSGAGGLRRNFLAAEQDVKTLTLTTFVAHAVNQSRTHVAQCAAERPWQAGVAQKVFEVAKVQAAWLPASENPAFVKFAQQERQPIGTNGIGPHARQSGHDVVPDGAFLKVSPSRKQDLVRHALLDVALQPLEQVDMSSDGRGAFNQLEIAPGIARHRNRVTLHFFLPPEYVLSSTVLIASVKCEALERLYIKHARRTYNNLQVVKHDAASRGNFARIVHVACHPKSVDA